MTTTLCNIKEKGCYIDPTLPPEAIMILLGAAILLLLLIFRYVKIKKENGD